MTGIIDMTVNASHLVPISRLLLDKCGEGNCFTAALLCAEAHAEAFKFDCVHVCHGIVTGIIDGERKTHWHAWVEVSKRKPGKKPGWGCIDVANGHAWAGSRERYYARGDINPRHVLRYDVVTARKKTDAKGHCGPWKVSWPTDILPPQEGLEE